MNRQTARLAQQESMPKKRNTLLQHTAVRPVAEHPSPSNGLAAGLGRDFTQVPVQPQTQTAGRNTTRSCPMSPQRCPFGGACHSCPPRVQAKLKIGQPGDRYEQEADRVAETVMRMPEPQAQRKCSAPGCKDEDEDKLVQTKSAGSAGNAQVDHPTIQNVLSSPGQPLDAGTRSFMEPRFGQDFSGVRVHVGGQAAESARAVNARAYTVGRDVVFGEGQYAPGSDEGKRLVAHELGHTIQQSTNKATDYLQRTIGDGHDLQSPRFAGDPVLEACFDNERYLRWGNRGEAVEKIQQALIDAGFSLPQFGVDGIFGTETKKAVQGYQGSHGLDSDGIIGPITIGYMDSDFFPDLPEEYAIQGGTSTSLTEKTNKSIKSDHKIEEEKYIPTPEAITAVAHSYSMMTENIWFDSWGNDLRDNDLDGTVDNASERGLSDGIHYHSGTRPYSANICPVQFMRTDQCPGFMQNSINVYYKVCIDVPKESYSSAGISMPSTRSIAAIIPWFRGNSKFQTWTKPSLPNVIIPGDFIAVQSGGHSHSGLVPVFGVPTPWLVDAIHLPGPTSRRSLGGQFTYWPSSTNDVFRTPWPFNIDFVARYKG